MIQNAENDPHAEPIHAEIINEENDNNGNQDNQPDDHVYSNILHSIPKR